MNTREQACDEAPSPADDPPDNNTWYRKFYECSRCGTTWHDDWSCLCNDRCPECRTETEPSEYIDLGNRPDAP
jgi:hypothetical protein